MGDRDRRNCTLHLSRKVRFRARQVSTGRWPKYNVIDPPLSTAELASFESDPTAGGAACLHKSSSVTMRFKWARTQGRSRPRITNYTRARTRKTWTSPGWIIDDRVCDSRGGDKALREPVYLATLSSVESAIEIKIDLHSDSGVQCSALINRSDYSAWLRHAGRCHKRQQRFCWE